eukprot:Lankesteria_metandrocarpae@DN4039_c0_g1_i1.p1
MVADPNWQAGLKYVRTLQRSLPAAALPCYPWESILAPLAEDDGTNADIATTVSQIIPRLDVSNSIGMVCRNVKPWIANQLRPGGLLDNKTKNKRLSRAVWNQLHVCEQHLDSYTEHADLLRTAYWNAVSWCGRVLLDRLNQSRLNTSCLPCVPFDSTVIDAFIDTWSPCGNENARVRVSSNSRDVARLLQKSNDDMWQSSEENTAHWVELSFTKRLSSLKKLTMHFGSRNRFMPKNVAIYGHAYGQGETLLSEVAVDQPFSKVLVENCPGNWTVIFVRIKKSSSKACRINRFDIEGFSHDLWNNFFNRWLRSASVLYELEVSYWFQSISRAVASGSLTSVFAADAVDAGVRGVDPTTAATSHLQTTAANGSVFDVVLRLGYRLRDIIIAEQSIANWYLREANSAFALGKLLAVGFVIPIARMFHEIRSGDGRTLGRVILDQYFNITHSTPELSVAPIDDSSTSAEEEAMRKNLSRVVWLHRIRRLFSLLVSVDVGAHNMLLGDPCVAFPPVSTSNVSSHVHPGMFCDPAVRIQSASTLLADMWSDFAVDHLQTILQQNSPLGLNPGTLMDSAQRLQHMARELFGEHASFQICVHTSLRRAIAKMDVSRTVVLTGAFASTLHSIIVERLLEADEALLSLQGWLSQLDPLTSFITSVLSGTEAAYSFEVFYRRSLALRLAVWGTDLTIEQKIIDTLTLCFPEAAPQTLLEEYERTEDLNKHYRSWWIRTLDITLDNVQQTGSHLTQVVTAEVKDAPKAIQQNVAFAATLLHTESLSLPAIPLPRMVCMVSPEVNAFVEKFEEVYRKNVSQSKTSATKWHWTAFGQMTLVHNRTGVTMKIATLEAAVLLLFDFKANKACWTIAEASKELNLRAGLVEGALINLSTAFGEEGRRSSHSRRPQLVRSAKSPGLVQATTGGGDSSTTQAKGHYGPLRVTHSVSSDANNRNNLNNATFSLNDDFFNQRDHDAPRVVAVSALEKAVEGCTTYIRAGDSSVADAVSVNSLSPSVALVVSCFSTAQDEQDILDTAVVTALQNSGGSSKSSALCSQVEVMCAVGSCYKLTECLSAKADVKTEKHSKKSPCTTTESVPVVDTSSATESSTFNPFVCSSFDVHLCLRRLIHKDVIRQIPGPDCVIAFPDVAKEIVDSTATDGKTVASKKPRKEAKKTEKKKMEKLTKKSTNVVANQQKTSLASSLCVTTAACRALKQHTVSPTTPSVTFSESVRLLVDDVAAVGTAFALSEAAALSLLVTFNWQTEMLLRSVSQKTKSQRRKSQKRKTVVKCDEVPDSLKVEKSSTATTELKLSADSDETSTAIKSESDDTAGVPTDQLSPSKAAESTTTPHTTSTLS